MKRIEQRFKELKRQKRCGLITYICAGDPDYKTSLGALKMMSKSGADIIELGVPFLDPAGDGPIIQDASRRAIKSGMTLKKIFKMVLEFRKDDKETPIILMGYYNPILKFGLDKVFSEAKRSGVDGFLIADLPPEEEKEVLSGILDNKLDLIRLIAPTTDIERAKTIAKKATGFLYLISLLGVTGTEVAKIKENKDNLKRLRKISNLPVAIGFGIKSPDQAKDFAKIGADALIVGSAIVREMAEEKPYDEIISSVSKKIQAFSNKINLKTND